MTPADQAIRVFINWLETADGYAFLTAFTSRMARFGNMSQGSLGAAGCAPDFSNMAGEERQDAVQDLCHDFLVFLLDKYPASVQRNLEIVHLLLSGQYRRVLELAWGRFVWQCQDQARNKEINPRGYLYRRLREILHQDNKYKVITDQRGLLYYYPVLTTVPDDDPPFFRSTEPFRYSNWPAPPPVANRTPEQYLFSAQWLASTALFFWQEATHQLGNPSALPIRELCRYLAEHHPWINKPLQQVGTDASDNSPDWMERLVDERDTPEEHLQRINSLASIAPLAAQLAATWTEEQRQVFTLHLAVPPPTFRDIGERLGFPDHNRAYALFQKAEKSLRQFITNWPGLPLSELPEEVAEAFIEEMKRICKKS